jgi:hypothetical protein
MVRDSGQSSQLFLEATDQVVSLFDGSLNANRMTAVYIKTASIK